MSDENAPANDTLGNHISLSDLPPPGTLRWVVQRKAKVVEAVNDGLLTVPEACRTYGLSPEELGSWQRAVKRDGLAGLYVSRHRKRGRGARIMSCC